MEWTQSFPAAITVCDTEGIILDMNDLSAKGFEKDGGLNLIGTNSLDCHPEPARSKFLDLLQNPNPNAYTIEKDGKKKLIYQAPWYENEVFAGIVEISIPLPEDVPHFVRK